MIHYTSQYITKSKVVSLSSIKSGQQINELPFADS